MAVCGYSTVCDQAGSDDQSVYKCSRSAADGKDHCVLHDSSYLDSGEPHVVLDALLEEIADSHRLVGFYLPALSLAGRTFDEPLYFDQCRFLDMVDFSNTHVRSTLVFNKCVFEAGANFTRAKFDDLLLFEAVTSDPAARFDFAGSNFTDIHILGSVIAKSDFGLANFHRAKFINNKFTGDVSMIDTRATNCDFVRLIFEKRARFTAAKFSGCVFKNVKFQSTATFELSFFDPDDRSVMNIDMSNVSLINADISGARFHDHTKWDGDHSHRTYDVRSFYSDPRPDAFVDTLAVLRSLRDNYEYDLMYRIAGQFFVQEMEMRRRYFLRGDKLIERPICHRIFSLTGLYFWICGYGESLKRAGTWLALLFGASLGYFALAAEASPDAGPMYASLDVFEKASLHLQRTLAAFFPLGGGDLPDYVVRATSIPLLGTLFIVIRRRLERKLRH